MSALAAALPAGTFGAAHILLTAGITAVLTLVAVVLLKVRGGVDLAVLSVLAFTATWLLRTAANMPQLNDDGLPGYSANDCLAPLAPVVTWVLVAVYLDLRGAAPGVALRRARAAAALLAFAVNVITI